MEAFAVRLIITIGIIWLTQVILDAIALKEPGNKIIFIVVIVAMVAFLLFGLKYFGMAV